MKNSTVHSTSNETSTDLCKNSTCKNKAVNDSWQIPDYVETSTDLCGNSTCKNKAVNDSWQIPDYVGVTLDEKSQPYYWQIFTRYVYIALFVPTAFLLTLIFSIWLYNRCRHYKDEEFIEELEEEALDEEEEPVRTGT